MPFVNRCEIIQVVPCLADTSKIRVTAILDVDIGDLLPYLNSILKRVIFNPQGRSLSLQKDGMHFSFKGMRISATKLRDVDHARSELAAFVDLINDVWARRAEIVPSVDRGEQLNALQVYKGLPGTNCKECGQLTCMAFAARLLAGDVSVLMCKPLFTPDFRMKRISLLELLEEKGYDVPPEFLVG